MEINKYTSGLVVSGYRLSDMYYRELSENLPKYFDILLIGSASAVSDNPSGLMSLTTPLKVFDLVNTVEMMIRQIDRRLKQDKRKPKKRSEREENYIHNAKRLLMDRNNLSEEEAHRHRSPWRAPQRIRPYRADTWRAAPWFSDSLPY